MAEPIIVTISHSLGRDEAKRRLENGLGHIRARLAPFVSSIDYAWTKHRLDFGLTAVRQCVTGRIDVEDRLVRITLVLPFLLQLLSRQIIGRITNEGVLLLNKPRGAERPC